MELTKKTYSIPKPLDELAEKHKQETGQSRDSTIRAGLLRELRDHYGSEYVRDWLLQSGTSEDEVLEDPPNS